MKKVSATIIFLLSTIMLLSVVLSACDNNEADNVSPVETSFSVNNDKSESGNATTSLSENAATNSAEQITADSKNDNESATDSSDGAVDVSTDDSFADSDSYTGNDSTVDVSADISTDTSADTSVETSVDDSTDESWTQSGEQSGEQDTVAQMNAYKATAVNTLNEYVVTDLFSSFGSATKNAVANFYNLEKEYIDSIDDLETAKAAALKIVDDCKNFVKNDLKQLIIDETTAVIKPLIDSIDIEDIKTSVENYYNQKIAIYENAIDLKDLADKYSETVNDIKEYIISETQALLVSLKNDAIAKLDPYANAIIDKIPFDDLKTSVRNQYNVEKKKLEKVENISDINECVSSIEDDLLAFAFEQTKNKSVKTITDLSDAGLGRLTDETLKNDLKTFTASELNKLNAAKDFDELLSTFATVLKETQGYLKDLLYSKVNDYLSALIQVETASPYDYIPKAMQPSYSANLVNASDVQYDFTSFVNVDEINRAGFGEQWQMVIENVEQSLVATNVFNAISTVMKDAASVLDIYFASTTAETLEYTFSNDVFTLNFKYDETELVFNVNLEKEYSIPVIGAFRPVVKLNYDLKNNEKTAYISLGDVYKIKYSVSDNHYEMAIKYAVSVAGKTGSRSTYLSIDKENAKTVGHIYEFTTLNGSDKIKACADFYVENGYVSVVGNKASGMIAFKGYVNELYLENAGRLIGYEVREDLTIAGVSGTYNTLWFNLWNVDGINNVKVTDKTDDNKSDKSTVNVYLNDSSNMLVPTYNKKAFVKTSRKYDIEYRTRYFYAYDAENNKYVAVETEVPMLFVQEGDNFNSFATDVKNDNGIDLSISLNTDYLNKILDDYDTLIDVFITHKDEIGSEVVETYLDE